MGKGVGDARIDGVHGASLLSPEEARWMERVVDARGGLTAVSIPAKVAQPLIERRMLRLIGPNLFITPGGIEALVYYRHLRAR